MQLTDEQFYKLCQANRDLGFEKTASGELVILSPAGSETGNRNGRLTQQLFNWSDEDGTGIAFDSSSGFKLPNGAKLGWLINRETQEVEIYRPGQTVEVLSHLTTLLGENVLPGFVLSLEQIWVHSRSTKLLSNTKIL